MRISVYEEQGESLTKDDKRVADFIEVILNDRIEELLEWGRKKMNTTSGSFMQSIRTPAQ